MGDEDYEQWLKLLLELSTAIQEIREGLRRLEIIEERLRNELKKRRFDG